MSEVMGILEVAVWFLLRVGLPVIVIVGIAILFEAGYKPRDVEAVRQAEPEPTLELLEFQKPDEEEEYREAA